MFVTKNQIYVFIASVAFGAVFGLFFSLLNVANPKNNKVLQIVFGCIFGALFGVAFIVYSYYLNFPTLRFYILFGVIAGFFAYFKSFHIILAKIREKIYNIRILKKVKKRNDRIKVQKVGRRHDRRRRDVVSDIDISNGVSVGRNRGA